MEKIIGRDKELERLAEIARSGRPEFVAVYGRRRVGKTFLVRRAFNDKFVFYATGVVEGSREDQLAAFNIALERYGYIGEPAANWMDAFNKLSQLLAKKCARRKTRQIVFIDELPCFDTANSGFVSALDFFWNSSASWMDNVMFVVCGSATSWMLKKLINSRGGLHKRLTHHIHLHPFDLATTEKYCRSRKGKWDRLSIMQAYSVLGGVPYYLSLLDFNKSVADNIDEMFFSDDAKLREEYRALYRAIYSNPEDYMAIINLLAKKQKGMTRVEIIDELGLSDNGKIGEMLEDLVSCDFLRSYSDGGKQNGVIYQLMDFFTLFYHRFGMGKTTDNHFWRNMLNDPKQNTFYGLAFERVGLFHFRHITYALGVSGVHTEFYSWRSKQSAPQVQIDMVIDRSDGIVNICEMKYSRLPYQMTAVEADKIRHREEAFLLENPDKQWTQVVVITTRGLKQNTNSDVAVKQLTLDDLFISITAE